MVMFKSQVTPAITIHIPMPHGAVAPMAAPALSVQRLAAALVSLAPDVDVPALAAALAAALAPRPHVAPGTALRSASPAQATVRHDISDLADPSSDTK